MAAFTLAAAADAQARIDEATAAPGDEVLAAGYEQLCQRAADKLLRDEMEQQHADWIDAHLSSCVDVEEGDDCTHIG